MAKKKARKEKTIKKIKIEKTALWQVVSAVLAIIIIILLMRGGGSEKASNADSAQEAGETAVEFINQFLIDSPKEAFLKGVEEKNGLYKIRFEVEGSTFPSYVSKDGRLLFLQEAVDMSEFVDAQSQR